MALMEKERIEYEKQLEA
jgi:hypothetical protein